MCIRQVLCLQTVIGPLVPVVYEPADVVLPILSLPAIFSRVQKIVDDPNGIHDVAIANRSKNRYHNVHTCKFMCTQTIIIP